MKRSTAALLLCLAAPVAARAQAISPGKLSDAHAELEGARNCIRCHELRRPGPAAERCLSCHEPLRARIAARTGLHGRMQERNCGECHKEHFGREFQLVRVTSQRFDHAETGYVLEGAHARTECGSCHRAAHVVAADVRAAAGKSLQLAHTSLGLSTSCRSCHSAEDPHDGQFRDRECDACHSPAEWEEAERFDHDRARYRLTGQHQQVACGRCHAARPGEEVVRYVGLAFASCRSCHEDVHRGAMGTECTQCHGTAGWQRVSASEVAARFDHGRTGFPLLGAHARAACEGCHGRRQQAGIRVRFAGDVGNRTYPRPLASTCGSCHLDPHGGALAAADCASCHDQAGWAPASFDAARHEQTRFPLTGAHATVPCGACHERGETGPPELHLPAASCARCHARQDPHGSAFTGRGCEDCHGTASFRIREWDHARAPGVACTSCHSADDPHGSQFAGRPCEQCHDTTAFRIPAFDHTRTRFPLEGKHAALACGSCHLPVPENGVLMVRYRPLPMRCEECHGGGE